MAPSVWVQAKSAENARIMNSQKTTKNLRGFRGWGFSAAFRGVTDLPNNLSCEMMKGARAPIKNFSVRQIFSFCSSKRNQRVWVCL
jgi:hypothetical protein